MPLGKGAVLFYHSAEWRVEGVAMSSSSLKSRLPSLVRGTLFHACQPGEAGQWKNSSEIHAGASRDYKLTAVTPTLLVYQQYATVRVSLRESHRRLCVPSVIILDDLEGCSQDNTNDVVSRARTQMSPVALQNGLCVDEGCCSTVVLALPCFE